MEELELGILVKRYASKVCEKGMEKEDMCIG